ncbi:hypothetical protein [Nocardia sp. NPDC004260]
MPRISANSLYTWSNCPLTRIGQSGHNGLPELADLCAHLGHPPLRAAGQHSRRRDILLDSAQPLGQLTDPRLQRSQASFQALRRHTQQPTHSGRDAAATTRLPTPPPWPRLP